MSKYMNASEMTSSNTQANDFQMKCEMNLSNYKAMVQNNFEKMVTDGDK